MKTYNWNVVFRAVQSVFTRCSLYLTAGDDQIRYCREVIPLFDAALSLTPAILSSAIPIGVSRLIFELPACHQLYLFLPEDSGLEPEAARRMAQCVINTALNAQTDAPGSPSQSRMTILLTHLFQSASHEDMPYVAMLSTETGIDLALERVVCVLRPARSASETMTKTMLEAIESFGGLHKQDILGSIRNGQVALCRILDQKELSIKAQTQDYLIRLSQRLKERLGEPVAIGVGVLTQAIADYPFSLSMAELALRFGNAEPVAYALDHLVEYVLENSPQDKLEHLLSPYVSHLEQSPAMLETVESLVLCDMDLTAAADRSFIHRNTLVFRLNQLRRALSIDPIQSDSDRCFLILLYHYLRLRRESVQSE